MKKRILVVDDSKKIRGSLKIILKDYEVVTASNGLEALETVTSQKIDLVISDIEMPKMKGLELARKIRSSSPRTSSLPLILMSGDATYVKEINALADYFLPKPFDLEELLAVVAKLLGK